MELVLQRSYHEEGTNGALFLNKKYPFFLGISETTLFLYGPIIFLYLKEVIINKKKSWLLNLIHFIPAIIVFVFLSPFFFRDIGISFIGGLTNLPRLYNHFGLKVVLVDFLIYYSHILVYFYLSYKVLRNQNTIERDNKSIKLQRICRLPPFRTP